MTEMSLFMATKVLLEGILHVNPISNFPYQQSAVPMERRASQRS
jgi:hypothetical protein